MGLNVPISNVPVAEICFGKQFLGVCDLGAHLVDSLEDNERV